MRLAPLAHRIAQYRFSAEDRLFLDTNIWYFIFGPPADPRDEPTRVYSGALRRALTAGSYIAIDALVLSEFVNLFIRTEYNQLKGLDPDFAAFKRYRRTEEYAASASAAVQSAQNILRHCDRIESDFSTLDVPALLDRFGTSQSDLTDEFIIETCRRHHLTLVTHDDDFLHSGLNILTHRTPYFHLPGA